MLGKIPPLSGTARVLEIGASILSSALRMEYGCEMHCAYHRMEPEWAERFAAEGIQGKPLELLRDPLPYGENVFDLVLLDQVLEHLPLAPHFLLRQVFRCLKPEGRLLLCVPNFARWENRWKLLRGGNPQEPMDGRFVYYAHHFEPVMSDCLGWVRGSGGVVLEKKWTDFGAESRWRRPSLRGFCFVSAARNPGTAASRDAGCSWSRPFRP
jgi:SAM-dependent methyltransferase